MREIHHLDPVSTFWEHIEPNLVSLEKDKHKEIHDILNIPMRVYSKLHRRERIANNWKIIIDPDWLRYRYDLKREYHNNIGRLDEETKNLHIDRFNKINWLYVNRLSLILNQPIENEQFDDIQESISFREDIHKQTNKEIILILNKNLLL